MRPEENRKYIEELAQRYDDLGATYKGGTFNEAQLRKEYVDVFFRALGWDVDNAQGYSESYKEVVHEDPIKLRGTTGHIDYSFRIGGVRKFIVETKKPAVNIRDDPAGALQIRTYAWNARLPLAILTDFEEWAIYDCTKKPAAGDLAGTARIEYFTYRELPDRWDHLVDIFSKERILQGSFDRFVASTKGKKGTVSVDRDFLALIESWRDLLARNLALRNPALSVDDLNIAVQRIIDRIIFLRICEDRGIEPYETLRNLLAGENVYPRLCALFERADDRYNSGLFHFSSEPGWDEMPDVLTPGLVIDDRVLREIIKRLYYPEAPYEFSVIPPAILGQVYEQFLGKVIRLTEGHQAKIEDKPEVKKAGGVFYTPEYIVDYIVRETVGRLVEGRTPAEVSSLRVLDPACGSGSFLIGAYEYLLDWHHDWYVEHLAPLLGEGRTATDPRVRALLPLVETMAGSGRRKTTELRPTDIPIYRVGTVKDEKGRDVGSHWRLKTAERKRILLNCIYGVDIDQQAVEVTKLSLLLKVLEDESAETITGQMKIGAERALPSLHKNIKCGNSLIGRDVLADRTLTAEEVARINPFDWDRGFPAIMAAGGFDAVIGNPPWGGSITSHEERYIRNYFLVARGRSYDTYSLFIEKGLNVAKPKGIVSYITPDTFLRKDDHQATRSLIFGSATVQELIETGPVFSLVRDTWALVFRLVKANPGPDSIVVHKKLSRFIVSAEERLERFASGDWDHFSEVPQQVWQGRPGMIVGYLSSTFDQEIIRKMENYPPLGKLNDIYKISRGEEGSKFNIQTSEDGDFFMVIPKDVSRYDCQSGVRVHGKTLTENKQTEFYRHPKIWIIRIQKMRWRQRIVATFDNRTNSCGMKTLQIITSRQDNQDELKYLLGIISSTLINYYCINYLGDDMNGSYLSRLPIRPIDPANPGDVVMHDRMVSLVETMLDLHRRVPAASTEHARRLIEVQIEATDREIDALVYDLYALTPDEIAVVEAGVARTV